MKSLDISYESQAQLQLKSPILYKVVCFAFLSLTKLDRKKKCPYLNVYCWKFQSYAREEIEK